MNRCDSYPVAQPWRSAPAARRSPFVGWGGRARADAKAAADQIAKFTGGKTAEQGKITIELPEIAENGNTVPLSVSVDAPMTADNYVSEVLVVAEGNPNPGVVTFHFSPMSGKAEASTRIRLATTQNIVVVAKTSKRRILHRRRSWSRSPSAAAAAEQRQE